MPAFIFKQSGGRCVCPCQRPEWHAMPFRITAGHMPHSRTLHALRLWHNTPKGLACKAAARPKSSSCASSSSGAAWCNQQGQTKLKSGLKTRLGCRADARD